LLSARKEVADESGLGKAPSKKSWQTERFDPSAEGICQSCRQKGWSEVPESYRQYESREEKMKKSSSSKVQKVMHEFKAGMLHSGSKKGPVVKSRKQAVAIALSEARKSKKGK